MNEQRAKSDNSIDKIIAEEDLEESTMKLPSKNNDPRKVGNQEMGQRGTNPFQPASLSAEKIYQSLQTQL